MDEAYLRHAAYEVLELNCQRLLREADCVLPLRYYTVEESSKTRYIVQSCEIEASPFLVKVVAQAITNVIADDPEATIKAVLSCSTVKTLDRHRALLVTIDSLLRSYCLYRHFYMCENVPIFGEALEDEADTTLLPISPRAFHFFDSMRKHFHAGGTVQ